MHFGSLIYLFGLVRELRMCWIIEINLNKLVILVLSKSFGYFGEGYHYYTLWEFGIII